jgi:hypothetical protein
VYASTAGAVTALTNDTRTLGPVNTTGGAGFDLAWGYPWHFSVVNEATKIGADLSMQSMMDACTGAEADKSVIFSENHDVSSQQHTAHLGRIPYRVDKSLGQSEEGLYQAQKTAMLVLGMVLTCRYGTSAGTTVGPNF